MNNERKLRCAIYTRVSTEHGLEQEFNSLDAQREAAEAYIKSQAHEGWNGINDRFDDGGYSGGSLERPALQSLLDSVKAKKIDVIVVYKVDRLTRSLADFAKLVELFDAHGASFVSVTQSFNTTSSMGRLTLNVLLSFAQFEREVTGERIRDKIAASKKKGLWVGGTVPYGYRLESRKLMVEPVEAGMVQEIFRLYLEIKSLPRLAETLANRGIMSRPRSFESGESVGGKPFRTGALSHLLGNRMYLGEINHRKRSYPGEHEPIVPPGVFAEVQALLADRRGRRMRLQGKSQSLLVGLIYDDAGNRMTPVHATKGVVRYRYYQSWVLGQGQKSKAGAVSRVPAGDVERLVTEVIAQRQIDRSLEKQVAGVATRNIRTCINRVIIHPNHIAIEIKPSAETTTPDGVPVSKSTGADKHSDSGDTETDALQPFIITVPWTKPTQARKRSILGTSEPRPSARPLKSETRNRIISGIAQARLWLAELLKGSAPDVAELAARHDRSERSVRSLLSLALLDPQIVEAAVANRLPRGIGITDLTELPADWAAQRQQLGLA